MAQTAWAQETFTLAIPNGFLIGEDYLKMNDQEKSRKFLFFPVIPAFEPGSSFS
jgi:hypothetical protein